MIAPRFLRALCISTAALSSLLPQAGSPVEGQILDSITGIGLPGIKVTVSSVSLPVITYEIYSAADGRFRFPLVAPGDYTILFGAMGYLPLPPSDPTNHIFHVADMASPVHFLVQLTPLGRISGRVFDGDGHPAPNVQIEMLRPRGAGVSINATDPEGRFTVIGLRPGSYVLLARPMLPGSGGDEARRTTIKPPASDDGPRLTWAATYYPGSTDRAGAQMIAVHAGANLTTYDIHLRASEIWRVRGVATDDVGKPVGGAELSLHSSEPLTGPEAKAKTNADGSFEFTAVCPGDWRILAEADRGKVMWKGTATVSVGHEDVEGVGIHLAAPFTVEGYVELDGARVTSNSSTVMAALYPADPSRDRQITSTVRNDSAMRFEGVYPARYRVLVSGFIPGFYIDSVRLGVNDVTGQPVDLAPGCPPIRIGFRSGAGRAVGLVENAPGVLVVLSPKNDALVAAQFSRSGATGPDGRFDIGSLRPGDYYIWAFDRVDMAAMADPDFVRTLIPLADTVHVEQGEVEVTPNLKLTPWPE